MKECQSLSYTKWDCKHHVFTLLREPQVAGTLISGDRKGHRLDAYQGLGELIDACSVFEFHAGFYLPIMNGSASSFRLVAYWTRLGVDMPRCSG